MSLLHTWAAAWGVPLAAVIDLQTRMGLLTPVLPESTPGTASKSEAWAQSAIRLDAAQHGIRLFRNNVGALKDESGRVVRYGLANDSAAMNAALKSPDLVGLRPVVITAAHVGRTLGVMTTREAKPPGWQYTGAGREPAQLAWAQLVNSLGGDAAFATGPGSFT